jgi:hypothetical protein
VFDFSADCRADNGTERPLRVVLGHPVSLPVRLRVLRTASIFLPSSPHRTPIKKGSRSCPEALRIERG